MPLADGARASASMSCSKVVRGICRFERVKGAGAGHSPQDMDTETRAPAAKGHTRTCSKVSGCRLIAS